MSILITGGMGNLGKYLTLKLLEKGYDNITLLDYVVDKRELSKIIKNYSDRNITVKEGDIRQIESLLEVMIDKKINKVFHLAAVLSTEGEENPIFAYQVNVKGTLNVFEASRICQIERIVFPSTISIFGIDAKEPVRENEAQHPTSFYGITKLICERIASYYFKRYGIDFVAVRFPRVVNPGRKSIGAAGYPSAMVENAIKGIPHIEVVNEDYTIPIIHFKEAVDILIKCYEAKNITDRIYNVNGLSVPAKEIANTIKKIIPSAVISFKSKKSSMSHLAVPLQYDDSRLRKELGNLKKYTIEELIKDFKKDILT